MAGFITQYVTNTISGAVSGAVTPYIATAGSFAGGLVSGVGNGINGVGSSIDNTVRGYGNGVKDYGNAIRDWTKAPGPRDATAVNPLGLSDGATGGKSALSGGMPRNSVTQRNSKTGEQKVVSRPKTNTSAGTQYKPQSSTAKTSSKVPENKAGASKALAKPKPNTTAKSPYKAPAAPAKSAPKQSIPSYPNKVVGKPNTAAKKIPPYKSSASSANIPLGI